MRPLHVLIPCIVVALAAEATPARPAALDEYVGRFGPDTLGPPGAVTFRIREDTLTMAPSFWRPPRILTPTGRDSFQLENFTSRTIVFHRDAEGRVDRVRISGLDRVPWVLHRLAPGDTTPAERLDRGDAAGALRAFRAAGADSNLMIAAGVRTTYVPTRVSAAAEFLAGVTEDHPHSAAAWAALGDARMAERRRDDALRAYRRACARDPANDGARSGLFRLGALLDTAGWKLPFALDSLFALPRPSEIRTVSDEWAKRDLGARGVRELLRQHLSLPGGEVELIALSHLVHGTRHVGLVLVPAGASPSSLSVLLEARGVNPSFSPLRVPEGLTAPGFLGDIRRRFIIGIPAFRGETLIVGGDTLRADGDPGDSWDGATDDLLAFLNVVLLAVPAASPDRVAIFGRSRGAAVAMLAAERDTRIGAVVAWAGPVDWFEAMGQTGWSVREAVADGLRVRANRFGPGGQFIATFLSRALDGHASLAACRRLMIASSPLWFAERLPLTKVHYGVDDGIVPERNGRLLAQRLADSDRTRECFRAWFHENAGHDQDLFQAPRESRRLLEQWAAGERRCTPRATRTLGTR